MSRARVRLLLAMAILARPVEVPGQSLVCLPAETIKVCVDRLANKTAADSVKAAAAAEVASVKKKTETGLDQVAGLSSSVKDFLPLLQLSGVLGPMQKDDQTGAISVALNTPGLIGLSKKDMRKELQLKAVIESSPKLFDGIKKALPVKDADAVEKGLLKGAEKKDNFALYASYTIAAKGLGRDFRQYQATYDALFSEVVSSVAANDLALVRAEMALSNAAVGVDLATTPWDKVAPAMQTTLDPLIRARAAIDIEAEAAMARAIRESGILLFGQLVNNQPQIVITGSHAERDNLFGPSLTTGSFSLEWNFGNALNDALDVDEITCKGTRAACVFEHYTAFVAANQDVIKTGDRVSIQLDVVHNPGWQFVSPDPTLVLDLKPIAESNTLSVRVNYGRLIGVEDDGKASGRLDVAVQYERPEDLANERWVTSATLTKKIGEMSIPFGLVYASNPKGLTGVDHGVTAHLGLKFNLFPATN